MWCILDFSIFSRGFRVTRVCISLHITSRVNVESVPRSDRVYYNQFLMALLLLLLLL